MKACARYFSPQGSHVLHTNPPVSQHVTHVKCSNGFSMLLNVLLCSLRHVCIMLFMC